MIISKLTKDDNIYYQLHAEQSITWALIDETGMGVFEEILTINTLERINENLINANNSNVFLDFKFLKSAQNNLSEIISEIYKSVKTLTFLNVEYTIVKKLGCDIFKKYNCDEKEIYEYYYLFGNNKSNHINTEDLFMIEFISYLKLNSLDSKTKGLLPVNYSSSVYLSKYIDVKKMITSNQSFFIYALYKLALKTKEHWKNMGTSNSPTLVCQNLNSSYLVSVLASFLNTDILILDKIGPINNLYSTLNNKIEENKEYIVVADVVCLGTEMKITKGIINFLGGKYLGNISVIRIQTLHPDTKKHYDTECIFEITNDNNPINYKIITNLDINE